MLISVLLILFCIYLWFLNKFSYWKKLGFPYSPGKFLLGSGPGIGITEHPSYFVKREYEKFKNSAPAFGAYLMAYPILVPTDPDLIRDIFVRKYDIFQNRGFTVSERADPLSQHLLFKNDDEWKNLRTKLSPTFTSSRMKMMFTNVAAKADRMVEYLMPYAEKNESIEMKEIYSSFSTEIIADVAFGIQIKCLGNPENEFRKMANIVFQPSILENLKLFFLIAFSRTATFLNIGYTNPEIISFFMKIVKETLDYRLKNNLERNDFFQLLMNIYKTDEISFIEFAANSYVFFLAGFETSSSAMMFSSYELALNQDIQGRLRTEINEVIAKHNGKVTYEAIMEMKYLDMVFNESMRKFPIVDLQHRKNLKDYRIPNTNLVIKAGTTIMIPVYCLHNDERFWENPDKFDPERFTSENIKKRHAFCYIPFSEGPRQCIGMRFGQMQTKVGLVKLLLKYKILPCEKTIYPMKFVPNATFQCPVGGMWLKLEKLENS
ncbi:hypothetical protein PVAND_015295 [Polypedilum vanderplanki]|uniref:Cytochrome P450 n=1 Tax=Polypedilum vanderplanki TaxID=319348 RepID=A0A9J6BC73_POLVA|nr:hypothetical protein PVAND_015295 [Polypedilum vanderplanki]